MLELILDFLDLAGDVRVAGRKVSDRSQDASGFFPAVLAGEPPWGFVAEPHCAEEHYGRQRLDNERDNVSCVAGKVSFAAKVDPESKLIKLATLFKPWLRKQVTYHDSKDDKQLVDTSQTTANGAWSVLGNVKRGDHGTGTDTKTGNEAANVHDGEMPFGGGLHDGT